MVGLVLSALRARRAQTVALFLLTVLAALGAATAPWFLAWGREAVIDADVATAPASQRVVTASGAARYSPGAPSPALQLRQKVDEKLQVPGADVVVGGRFYATMTTRGAESATAGGVETVTARGAETGLYLTFRDGVCDQLRLTGECPRNPGDVVLGELTGRQLGLRLGDSVTFEGFRLAGPHTLRVSGFYEVIDVLAPYWAATDLLGRATTSGPVIDQPAFTSEETLLGLNPNGLDLDLHLVLPPSAYRGDPAGAEVMGTLDRAATELRQSNLDLKTRADALIEQIRADQRLVLVGVTVAAGQLLLLCWFTLFLAVRHTSEQVRPDIGLLKLRGTAPWRIWTVTALQSALPMVAGALTGWVLGYVAAAALAGGLGAPAGTEDTSPLTTLGRSGLAATVACVGALISAVLAEWRVLGSPVLGLLRRVPARRLGFDPEGRQAAWRSNPWRRRGWRAEVGDLVVVVVAVAGVYQGHAESGGPPSAFSLIAPGLVGLAVALVLARALPAVASRAGGSALRAGRPGLALTALHLARRPGTHRLFAVIAVSVSVFTTATFAWQTASGAWTDRAALDLGASRVLTVRAGGSTALLAAVRAADPEGRYAMAVSRTNGLRTEDRVLAVDSARLGTVTGRPELAGLLHPPAPPTVRLADGIVSLDAAGPPEPVVPAGLRLYLTTVDGTIRTVDFGPLGSARAHYHGMVTGCGSGCRLTALEPRVALANPTANQGSVSIYALGQDGADPVVLDDITRWRPQAGAIGIGDVLTARDGRLVLTPFVGVLPTNQRADRRVFSVDAPNPLPAVLAGPRPAEQRDARISPFGAEQVPFEVVGAAEVLPRIGDLGVLVDLEYAQRTAGVAIENTALEVWLTADAPQSVIDALGAHGVTVLAEQTVGGARQRLADQGPGVVLRFQLFAAIVVLLLAAGGVLVTATVEHRARVDELVALRAQGLPSESMVMAGYGGTGGLVLGATLAGVIAAVLGQLLVTASMPVFADNWSLLEPPAGVAPLPLLVATLVAAAVVGLAAASGAARVVATVES